MTVAEIVVLVAGFTLPVIAAPFVAYGLGRLFAIFLAQGTELFGDFTLRDEDALVIGAVMAKFNVAILLVAWLALFTCDYFDQRAELLAGIAIGGLVVAFLVSTLVVRANLEIRGGTLAMVALLAFAGGNLPLIVLVGALLALLP